VSAEDFKILILEDEAIIRMVTKRVLSQGCGATVLEADKVDPAIALALEHRPEVIIVDIHLKEERTGLDAAREIRKHYSPRIYIMSAYEPGTFADAAELSEFSGIFSKPTAAKTLLSICRRNCE
jgi:CheY-like chemotaxis protein